MFPDNNFSLIVYGKTKKDEPGVVLKVRSATACSPGFCDATVHGHIEQEDYPAKDFLLNKIISSELGKALLRETKKELQNVVKEMMAAALSVGAVHLLHEEEFYNRLTEETQRIPVLGYRHYEPLERFVDQCVINPQLVKNLRICTKLDDIRSFQPTEIRKGVASNVTAVVPHELIAIRKAFERLDASIVKIQNNDPNETLLKHLNKLWPGFAIRNPDGLSRRIDNFLERNHYVQSGYQTKNIQVINAMHYEPAIRTAYLSHNGAWLELAKEEGIPSCEKILVISHEPVTKKDFRENVLKENIVVLDGKTKGAVFEVTGKINIIKVLEVEKKTAVLSIKKVGNIDLKDLKKILENI